MSEGTGTDPRGGMTGFLARRLRGAGRGADEAFTVAELRRSLLPYPRCRTALGLASKAEYDVAVLRLLDGDGVLEADDPGLGEEVERELASPEPGLGVLDDHAATALRPGPRLREALRAEGPTDADGDGSEAGVVSRSSSGAPPSGACDACGGDLPGARGVRFCPHCGEGLGALRCGECGREVETGWRYCPFCGSERHE